jgi:DNA-directed RNA polymerase specialized sigma24 family protein
MLHQNDLELARSAAQGDYAAFAKLYELYLPPVLAFARVEASGAREAADLAAAILAAAFSHLEGYRGRSPLAAWVLAVARKVRSLRQPDQAASTAARAAR